MTTYSVAWRSEVETVARKHLLEHYHDGRRQEDIALATWYPADGVSRHTAIIDEILLPEKNERILKGNVQLTSDYLRRCRELAISKGAGMAVMHNHLGPGWQDMSPDDILMERRSVSNPARATGLPALGLTLGTDGIWSARFWIRKGSRCERHWCSTIRIIAPEHLSFQTNPHHSNSDPKSISPERFRRSIETWGVAGQKLIGQLKVGIVGLGSVGALAAEAMGRIGIQRLVLIDMDRVEHHNLDRLIHASPHDIGKLKVQLAASNIERIASQPLQELLTLPCSLRESRAFRTLADCDVILACADKPVARDLINHLAVCHLIPAIEAGVALRSRNGSLHKGHVVSQIVTPDSRCLRCTGQYTTDQVSLELEGLLENPEYIRTLPADQHINTANVFPASLAAASQQANLFTRMILGAEWWPPVYQQTYHYSVASQRTATKICKAYCDVHARKCTGNFGEPGWLLISSNSREA